MKAIGVRFRRAGKTYPYDAGDLDIRMYMKVVADTSWGVELGTVVYVDRELPEHEEENLRTILRIATAEDLERDGKNRQKEQAAFRICEEKIAKHKLEMRLVAVEYTFDNSKILFYFTADQRIDFRELVKDLASVFHTRIELRQIGVRDETKILGGLGICGRVLCCHSYLSEFQPVSIRMAKDQNLSLNPAKISGMCGRLMCCLKNEQDTYEYLNGRLPNVGDFVTIKDGDIRGTVQSVNVLRQTVRVMIGTEEDPELRDCKVEELYFHAHHRRPRGMKFSAEEMKDMKALEALEKDEKNTQSKLN